MRETLTLQAIPEPVRSDPKQRPGFPPEQESHCLSTGTTNQRKEARTKERLTNHKREKRGESRAYRLAIPCSLTKILANGGAETEKGRRRANGDQHHNPWSEGMREKEAGSGKWFWTPGSCRIKCWCGASCSEHDHRAVVSFHTYFLRGRLLDLDPQAAAVRVPLPLATTFSPRVRNRVRSHCGSQTLSFLNTLTGKSSGCEIRYH
jgi:hypothetical protein